MVVPKFLLRFDDVTPEMAWSRFDPFDELSSDQDLPLLVGVVPKCLDETLVIEPAETRSGTRSAAGSIVAGASRSMAIPIST